MNEEKKTTQWWWVSEMLCWNFDRWLIPETDTNSAVCLPATMINKLDADDHRLGSNDAEPDFIEWVWSSLQGSSLFFFNETIDFIGASDRSEVCNASYCATHGIALSLWLPALVWLSVCLTCLCHFQLIFLISFIFGIRNSWRVLCFVAVWYQFDEITFEKWLILYLTTNLG